MPKLQLPNGDTIRYKTVALYPGVKRIDKEIAAENLSILKEILEHKQVPFQLHTGTALGAVREKDFIAHDEDIDLAILERDRDAFLNAIPALMSAGFMLCRYDGRDLYSLMRLGEYVDFYVYRPWEQNEEIATASGWLTPRRFVEESKELEFKGDIYKIPQDIEEYLCSEYGTNWKVPVDFYGVIVSPIKRFKCKMKEHLKDMMPRSVFRYLSARAERRLENQCVARLRRNGFLA